jgi:hypothetical protein
MAHMPTVADPESAAATSGGIIVTYTATGLEGTYFLVPIGQTLATSDYEIVWSPRGVVSVVPMVDLPDEPGDRTTTFFRVVTADVLTEGDKLVFILFEATA